MATKVRYRCSACGHEATGWTGKCPVCDAWGTMEEVEIKSTREKARSLKNPGEQAMPLPRVSVSEQERLDLGSGELNRVLGGGLVPDSVSMLTARPGAGKSTLLLQVAGRLAERGIRVLYASGEESAAQIRGRADRILPNISEEIFLMATSSLDAILDECGRLKPAVLMIDSIQTMALDAYAQRPGTPTQTVQCTAAIVDACKNPAHPMAAFVIGHVTKDEQMAGLRTLEHQVDTVLFLETGFSDALRMLRTTKNRFGYTDEVGLFRMGADGLSDMTDPYTLFLTRREKPVSGAAIALQKEGSRLMPIEIEALVSYASDQYPSRIGDSLKRDALNTLVSILEERVGYRLGNRNVVLKATGGLRMHEGMTDLAILVAIASAAEGWTVLGSDAFCAEVGLTGELKRTTEMERRIRELDRLGFQRVFIAKEHLDIAKRLEKELDIRPICLETVRDVIQKIRPIDGRTHS